MAARWINGSRAMVSVNSIFAGFSGGLLVAILRTDATTTASYVACALATIALLAFAFAAERVTDALDEGKVGIYVWSMQAHNIGVMTILCSLATFLYLNLLPCPYYLLPVLAALYWAYHFVWLLSTKNRAEHVRVISDPE